MAIQTFQIPQMTLSTTDTTLFDLINGTNQSTTFNLMPYAGIVKRILFGYNVDIGEGAVRIQRYPNGIGPVINGANNNYTATAAPFTKKVDVNVPFDKDDGIEISFQAGDLTTPTKFFVSLEVEFTLS